MQRYHWCHELVEADISNSENATSDVRHDRERAERRRLLLGRRGTSDLRIHAYLGPANEFVVELEGEADVYTAPYLRSFFIEAVQSGYYDMYLDLERAEFLDSTGLGVLVGQLKRCRAHDGNVTIICYQERILKILRINGFIRLFKIFDTPIEAFAAAGKSVGQGLSVDEINEELEARDWIPVRLYLSDAANHEQVEDALRDVIDEFGLEINYEFPAVYGSYWREFGARFKKRSLGQLETERQFARIQRELQLQIIAEDRSMSLESGSESVAQLITALQDVANAVIQIGPVLLVKYDGTIICRNMSSVELIFYERNPLAFRDPETTLRTINAMEQKRRRTNYSDDLTDYRHALNPRTKKIHLAVSQHINGQGAAACSILVARCGNAKGSLEETNAAVSCVVCMRIGSQLAAAMLGQSPLQASPVQAKASLL